METKCASQMEVGSTFAEYGLPVVGRPLIVTLTLCSPTERGTKSALKTPSAVCDTWAGIDCPDGPVYHMTYNAKLRADDGQTMKEVKGDLV